MRKTVITLCAVTSFVLTCSVVMANERVAMKTEAESRGVSRVDGPPSPVLQGELPLESFEDNFVPEGWSKETINGNPAFEGWQQLQVGSPVPGFQEGTVDAPDGGGDFVAYAGWASGDSDGDFETGASTDQWLITPQITNVQADDVLKFYLKYFNGFGDVLDILISTETNAREDFTTVVDVLDFTGSSNNDWTMYEYSLSDFVAEGTDIYIAFREHVEDTSVEGDALFLDLVEVVGQVTSVEEDIIGPELFALKQNYPNPFNPTTKITFQLEQNSKVSLKVYDLLGQEVATLLDDENYSAGSHTINFDGSNLANGVYFYRLESGAFIATRRMTILK